MGSREGSEGDDPAEKCMRRLPDEAQEVQPEHRLAPGVLFDHGKVLIS